MNQELDNFDRLLLGYLAEHPDAMYREMALALGVSRIVVDQRLQGLYHRNCLTLTPEGNFLLTKRGRKAAVHISAEEEVCSAEFSWEELYIPQELILE